MVPAGKADTSRTSPMTAAALTGPTPNGPVRLVPAAAMVTASFLRVSRIRVSMRRRSSSRAAASSQRAACTTPSGLIARRTPGGASRSDHPGNTAGGQLAQHRLQLADHSSLSAAACLPRSWSIWRQVTTGWLGEEASRAAFRRPGSPVAIRPGSVGLLPVNGRGRLA